MGDRSPRPRVSSRPSRAARRAGPILGLALAVALLLVAGLSLDEARGSLLLAARASMRAEPASLPRTGAAVVSGAPTRSALPGSTSTAGPSEGNGSGLGPNWKELAPATNPGPRMLAAMTYDAAEGYVVLFGGDVAPAYNGSNASWWDCTNATWTYRDGTWTNLSIPGLPASAGCTTLMAYDPEISAVIAVLSPNYAGYYGGDNAFQTWEFAGDSWSRLNISTPDLIMGLTTMAYDAASQSVILFGSSSSLWANDSMWAFTGSSWQEVLTTPSQFSPGEGGQQPVGDYDSATGQFLLIQVGDLFAFSDGVWSDLGGLPFQYDIYDASEDQFAYDPALVECYTIRR